MFCKFHASRRAHSSAGLTMVEIAVVILILAILLAGILGAREVVRISRLRKIATETQSFGVAARSFEQKYDALPGDFSDASTVLPNCGVSGISAGNPYGNPTNAFACRNGNGDGRVGRYCHFRWPECGQAGSSIPASDPNGDAVNRLEAQETSQFWKHLFLAELITGGIDARYDPNAQPRWRFSHPESAVWNAGYTISGQAAFIGGSVVVNFVPNPEYNLLSEVPAANTGGDRSLSVLDALYIDEKFDNGGPGTGAIWWNPITTNGTGCRADDSGSQNTWERLNTDKKNCVFSWTVF